jgi:hypothetical protein
MVQATRSRTRLAREERREQILDAATVVFIGRDPVDVTFEEIAEAGGAPLVRAWDGVSILELPSAENDSQTIRLRTPTHDYGDVTLAGVHTCRYCMPYENDLSIFLARQRQRAYEARELASLAGLFAQPSRRRLRRDDGGCVAVVSVR